MRHVLAAHVAHDALRRLFVVNCHVDLEFAARPERLPARRAQLVLHPDVVRVVEVPTQLLRRKDLPALDADAFLLVVGLPEVRVQALLRGKKLVADGTVDRRLQVQPEEVVGEIQ